MADSYDFLVLGGGSGGLACAQRAAEYGARTAVIERARLGGTCVNVGCVPKKVMFNAAGLAHSFHDAREYGFKLPENIEHGWQHLKQNRDAYIKRLNGIYARNLSNKSVDYIAAEASLADAHTVIAGEQRLTAPHVLIATGGEPLVPDLEGADLGITSDGFFELDELPGRVAVAGGGYIAVELAGVLRALGAQVTLFYRYESVLRNFDATMQQGVLEAMANDGIELRPNSLQPRLRRTDAGISATLADDSEHGPFDQWLWAIGRRPLTSGIGLEAAGVEVDDQGFVTTDKFQQTNVEGVYAVGDITGRDALTPVAIAAGRRLADRVFGGMEGRHLDYRNIASVVFSHPPVGTCGLTEAEAREQHGDAVRIYQSEFVSLFNGVTTHKPKTRMKLVTIGEEERVAGVHIHGPGADEMLQGFAVAIKMGACKRDFDDTVAIHPTSAEELVTMR